MPNPRKPRPQCSREGCTREVRLQTAKFCSHACQFEAQYRAFLEEWLAGRNDGLIAEIAVSRHIRRYVKETQGERCVVCGWAERNPHTGRIPLHLDHIDGDWRNNRPENLRLPCPNHHALTSSYGSQNRGRGRPYVVQKRAPTPAKDAEVGVQNSGANLPEGLPTEDD